MKKTLLRALVLIALMAPGLTKAQTTCPYPTDVCGSCVNVYMPADYIYCPGFPFSPGVIVPTGFTVTDYAWSPTTDVSPSSGTGNPASVLFMFSNSAPATYTLTVNALGPNLINDGDFSSFSSSTPCFSSAHPYYSSFSTGGYTIATSYTSSSTITDHTTGTGNMMLVSFGGNASPVWKEANIPVCSDKDYVFEAWFTDLISISTYYDEPLLQVVIKDAATGSTLYTSGIYATYSMGWNQIKFTLPHSAGVSNVDIEINDLNAQMGNMDDFALDDISFRRKCTATASMNVTSGAPVGPSSVCVSSTATYTDAIAGGTWSSSDPMIASIDPATGILTGMSAGVVTITYSATGCTKTVTVNPLPSPIAGVDPFCSGASELLTSAPPGGVWSSSDPTVIWLSTSFTFGGLAYGSFYGANAGTAIITYTLPTGCFTTRAFSVSSISGPSSVCVGQNITLTDPVAGGRWTVTPAAVASIGSTGVLTGLSAGVASVTYTTSACSTIFSVTVNSLPAPISGPDHLCVGDNISLTDATAGGTWASSYTFGLWLLSSSSVGDFHGGSAGLYNVTYTLPTGCFVTQSVTVNPLPNYFGDFYLCYGTPLTLTATPSGGTWSSSGTAATVSSSGVVTTAGYGSVTITYTLPTGCYRTATLWIYNCAGGDGIPTPPVLCVGSTITLTLATGIATGGTWSSSNTSIATVDATTGVVTAVSAGTVTITYTVGGMTYTTTVTVRVPPTACVSLHAGAAGYDITATAGATVYFYVTDGTHIHYDHCTGSTTLYYSTLTSSYGFSALRLCVYGVEDFYCYIPVSCCVDINPSKPGTTHHEAQSEEHLLTIVPNPNSGTFTVSCALADVNAQETTLEVVDMMGRTVYHATAKVNAGTVREQVALPASVANGVYIVRIKNGGANAMTRFVLDR